MIWIAIGAIVTGLSMASTYSTAQAQEKALKEKGTIAIKEREKRTIRIAGQQKAAFLSSGIALTGEGTPTSLIGETYETGIEDMDLIRKNVGSSVSNVWGQARTKMISQFGQFALSAGMGGMPSLGSGSQVAGSASVGSNLSTQQYFQTSGFGGF